MRARLPSPPSSSSSARATRAAGASLLFARGPQPPEGVGSELAQSATRRCRLPRRSVRTPLRASAPPRAPPRPPRLRTSACV
eukprot:2446928-Pleurochrysis_carterae.AAC.1